MIQESHTGCIYKRIEIRISKRYLHSHVHCSVFIAAKNGNNPSFHQQMNEYRKCGLYIYTKLSIIQSLKRRASCHCDNMGKQDYSHHQSLFSSVRATVIWVSYYDQLKLFLIYSNMLMAWKEVRIIK